MPQVRADARAFDAVCRNLLQNAVVHGGATSIDVAVETSDADRVRVSVRDNGRGVPAAMLSRLGQAFERGPDTGKTGVGLFVSRQLTARMGGTLTFPPTDGGGFLAVIEMPGER